MLDEHDPWRGGRIQRLNDDLHAAPCRHVCYGFAEFPRFVPNHLGLTGGECDSIHLFWNHASKSLDWWRA